MEIFVSIRQAEGCCEVVTVINNSKIIAVLQTSSKNCSSLPAISMLIVARCGATLLRLSSVVT